MPSISIASSSMTSPGVKVQENSNTLVSISTSPTVAVFLYQLNVPPASDQGAGEDEGGGTSAASAPVSSKAKSKQLASKPSSKILAPVRKAVGFTAGTSRLERIADWITFTRKFAGEDGVFKFDPKNVLHLAVQTYLHNGGGPFYTVLVDDQGEWAQLVESRGTEITLVVQAGVPLTAEVSAGITTLCNDQMRFGVFDGPKEPLTEALLGPYPAFNNGAVFYPWLTGTWAGEELIPPSAAVAGAMCLTDEQRGIWSAAANIPVYSAQPIFPVSDDDQSLYMGGKAVNMIRSFYGRSAVIWGARTLTGSSEEDRYITVRRLMISLQKDISESLLPLVFQPNNENTWSMARATIKGHLFQLWKAGGLMGARQDEAFTVKVGLGETMTEDDILQGRMEIRVSVAISRPAEFIILNFSQIMGQPTV